MAVWRYADTGHGELYALNSGMTLMPALCAANWTITLKVCVVSEVC